MRPLSESFILHYNFLIYQVIYPAFRLCEEKKVWCLVSADLLSHQSALF